MRVRRNERGMVLLLVLVVVALLAALLTEFAYSSLVDLRLAETFRDTTRAYYLASGGARVGRMLLQEDDNGYDGTDELWSQGVIDYPVGDGTVSIAIEDLGGRVDLNRLVDDAGNVDVPVMDRCLRLFDSLGLDDPAALVDTLIDWLDPDGETRTLGAESEYYLGLERPYPAKDAPLESLDELLLVRGFDGAILKRLAPHITVHGAERINVNTASAEVLLSLAEEMDRPAAEAIIDARREAPFRNLERLKALPEMETLYSAIHLYVDIKSPTFSIAARGDVGDGVRTVRTVVARDGDRILYQRVD